MNVSPVIEKALREAMARLLAGQPKRTVIAALHHDNQALREHLDSRAGKVADLNARRTSRLDRP